jgi:uncharacterized protein (DUF4415 family)
LDDSQYTNAPPEVDEAFDRSVEISKDFMPSPRELANATVKKFISIRIDSDSIDFFKEEAKAHGTHYQTMINDLLGAYVRAHRRAG